MISGPQAPGLRKATAAKTCASLPGVVSMICKIVLDVRTYMAA